VAPPAACHYYSAVRRTSIFIGLFLAIQLALPLSYYTCRQDTFDERFAWRMFSPTRFIKCSVSFTVNGKRENLHQTFHEAWVNLAKRARRDVLWHMADRLCHDNKGADVRLRMTCRALHGKRSQPYTGAWDFCRAGTL